MSKGIEIRKKKYATFIFHYNRGKYLINAINSVKRNTNSEIFIIDDNSNHKESKNIIDELSNKFTIIKSVDTDKKRDRTGGLHENMNQAIDLAYNKGFELALMMQDDMQIVREISDNDINSIIQGFRRPNASFVINCNFFKKSQALGDLSYILNSNRSIYEIRNDETGKYESYSDTGFFSIPIYKNMNYRMISGENNNVKQLQKFKLRLGILAFPLMHFTPMPTSFRSRKRHLRDRVADWIAGAGVHPIEDMNPEMVRQLVNRDVDQLAFAEDYLSAPTLPKVSYWPLRGGRSNLAACLGWKRIIYKLLWTDFRKQ